MSVLDAGYGNGFDNYPFSSSPGRTHYCMEYFIHKLAKLTGRLAGHNGIIPVV
jgi:hypothetical protein